MYMDWSIFKPFLCRNILFTLNLENSFIAIPCAIMTDLKEIKVMRYISCRKKCSYRRIIPRITFVADISIIRYISLLNYTDWLRKYSLNSSKCVP